MQMTACDVTEQPSPWERLTLAGGIAFAVTQFAAVVYADLAIFPQKPPIGAPVAQQVAFYVQHGAALATGNYLLAVPAPFLLLFLGGLFGVLRRAEGGSGALTVAAIGSGTAMAMLWPFGCLLTNMSVTIAQNGGDAATAWAFDGLAPLSLALSALPRAVLLLGASALLLHTRCAPRPLGWLGLALGLLSCIGTGTLVVGELFPILLLGVPLFALWTLLLSVALLRRPRAASQRVPQMAPVSPYGR